MEIWQVDNMPLQDPRGYTALLHQDAKNLVSYDDKSHLSNSASRLMITPNPDGTFTVGKEPPNGNSKDTKANKGPVIPPQGRLLCPYSWTPEKKQ